MALSFDSTTSLVLVDVSSGSKVIRLPPASERPGRIITIKDTGSCGKFGTNDPSISILCSSGDTFETLQPFYLIGFSFGFINIVADTSIPGWRILSKSQITLPYEFEEIDTIILSAGQGNISSISTNYLQAGRISTIGQAAFYSSVQIQGGLSVFSSISAYDLNYSGNLYQNGVLINPGAVAGINSAGTIGIGGASNANVGLLVNSNLSTLGQAAFYSSVQIQGGLSVFSSISAYDLNYSGNLYQNGTLITPGAVAGINSAGNIGINSASNSSNALFVTGSQSNTSNIFVAGSVSTFGNEYVGGIMQLSTGRITTTRTNISFGSNAASTLQGIFAIAIGTNVGLSNQSLRAVAIGNNCGVNSQGTNSVAIGSFVGSNNQGSSSVAIGNDTGLSNQGTNCIAFGTQAAQFSQSTASIAIGFGAGQNNQNSNSIAIGTGAGGTRQSTIAIAIGSNAGFINQGANTVAIGRSAGNSNQGLNAIAIGNQAGVTNQSSNSIILNASGTALDNSGNTGLFINPVEFITGGRNLVSYNPTTSEVFYSDTLALSSISTTGQASFYSSVQIQGGLSVFSSLGAFSLGVVNNVTIGGSLTVTGTLVSGNLSNTSNTGTLGVAGSTTLGSNLSTVGQAAFYSSVQIQGGLSVFSSIGAFGLSVVSNTTIGGTVVVAGSTTLNSNLSTVGQAAFYSSVQMQGGLSVFSSLGAFSLGVVSNVTIGGTLTVTGATRLNSNLSTIGQAAFYSSVQIQGGLSVFSSISAYNLNYTGDLIKNGVPISVGAVAGINSAGTIGIGGASNANVGLYVYSNLSTIGQAAFYSSVQIQGGLSVFSSIGAHSLGVFSSVTIGGTLGVTGITNLASTLNVTGDIIASGNVTAYSDLRAKDNIVTIDSPLDKIMKMRGVYYTRKDLPERAQRYVGVIAQEMEEILPEVVLTDTTEEKKKSVAYGNITALLIECVKAQQSTINSLLHIVKPF